jgi:hypothetical protein
MNVLQNSIEFTPACAMHQTMAIKYQKLTEGVSLWVFASFCMRWSAFSMAWLGFLVDWHAGSL